MDSGVSSHIDLRRNLLPGTDVTSSANSDGHSDHLGHGTEMAGLIAAHGRRNDGALGIAPSAKILPTAVTNSRGDAGSLEIAEGINWATTHSADIVNVSAVSGPTLALRNAVNAAARNDALVVAGTGNRPSYLDLGYYPAAIPGVLAVGATDRNGKHADFSIKSPQIQLCAPGTDILSTRPDNKYSVSDGTSSATAIVSGAAALVRSKFPALSAQEVIHRLTATATDIGPPGRDDECGFGELNILKALTADVPVQEPTTAPPPSVTPSAGAAAPGSPPERPNFPAIVGGVAGGLLFGGLLVYLAVRRRARRR